MTSIPYWYHATLFEILWLISGAIGATITWKNLRDSLRDQEFVDELRDDPTMHRAHFAMIRLAARARRESQMTRLAICVLICATGIVGVIQKNPLHGKTTWTGFVLTASLVAISALTAHRSFLDWRQRNAMRDLSRGRSAVIAAEMRARALSIGLEEE